MRQWEVFNKSHDVFVLHQFNCPGSLPPIPLTRESVPGYVYIRRSVALKSNYKKYSDIYHIHRVPVISTTVLLCTIVLPVFFFLFCLNRLMYHYTMGNLMHFHGSIEIVHTFVCTGI